MKIPFMLVGAGSALSDDCTATAEDVLESKTAVYDGSDDEAEYGTMVDYSGTSQSGDVTNNSSSSRVELTVPKRGLYSTASKIYTAFSTLASAISLTAAKIATGNTILGIAGTYTGLGSATQAQVLSGKTFSTASLSNASGTMTDKSGTSTAATSSVSGSNVRLQIPTNAYYNTSAYLTNSYSNMASTIGLTAAKIKNGTAILGITGTVKELTSTGSSFSISTSGVSTETWTDDAGNSHKFRHVEYGSISFTPQYALFFNGEHGTWCSASSCNVISSTYGGYYLASGNSNYKFDKSGFYIPYYYTSSETVWFRILGYT